MKSKLTFGILLACTAVAEAATPPGGTAESFRQRVAARAEAALRAGETVVRGVDGWLYLATELRHVGAGPFWGPDAAKVSRAAKPERADPLPAILDFHRQLKQAGVELWVVPVPPKAVVIPEMLFPEVVVGPGAARLDTAHRAFYRRLAEEGVEVVDLTDNLLAAKAGSPSPVYCRTDSHWSGPALTVAAQVLAAKIRERAWHGAVPKHRYLAETNELTITGDLAGSSAPGERVFLRHVGTGQPGRLTPVGISEASPVLLLGDSHNLVFHEGNDMHARGAGLPDQLALELGHPVDMIAVRGSGATPARVNLLRKVRRVPDYLGSKKVVIWCFTAREFTEGDGWANVPVVP